MINTPAPRETLMARHDDEDEYDDRPASRRRRYDDEEDDERDARRGRRRHEDDEDDYDFRKRDEPHSGLGIASLVLAVVAGLGLLLLFGIGAAMAEDAGGELGEESPEVMVLGAMAIGACALALVGLVLGLVALAQKDRRKAFGVAGVIANGLVLLGASTLICVGAMMN
jgi:hypothetical protein